MKEREQSFDEVKQALNEARRRNKTVIIIWIIYIVCMLCLAVYAGINGMWARLMNDALMIIFALYIIYLHTRFARDFDMLNDCCELIEHMYTSHHEYVEKVEAIFTEARRAAAEKEKKEDEV